MPFNGSGWAPVHVARFIQAFGSATGAARVETEMGDGYLKALGNPEGPHALACDLVGSQLADWLGLPTFDFSLIQVTAEDEIPFLRGGKGQPGRAFISRAVNGFPWGGDSKTLKSVINPLTISGLVVIDTWTLNYDRCSPDRSRVNRDNVFLIESSEKKGAMKVVAMDFTHAFRQGQELNRRLTFIETIQDTQVYGLFPEFQDFLDQNEIRRLCGVLGTFRLSVATNMIRVIPREWEVDADGRAALAKQITDRAHFLADRFETILFPEQLSIEGGA